MIALVGTTKIKGGPVRKENEEEYLHQVSVFDDHLHCYA